MICGPADNATVAAKAVLTRSRAGPGPQQPEALRPSLWASLSPSGCELSESEPEPQAKGRRGAAPGARGHWARALQSLSIVIATETGDCHPSPSYEVAVAKCLEALPLERSKPLHFWGTPTQLGPMSSLVSRDRLIAEQLGLEGAELRLDGEESE